MINYKEPEPVDWADLVSKIEAKIGKTRTAEIIQISPTASHHWIKRSRQPRHHIGARIIALAEGLGIYP